MSTAASSTPPQEQGRKFEEDFRTLIDRLLTKDLGCQVLENRIQPGGTQYGKDIQTRWRTDTGAEIFWHFECKSHRSGSLPKQEIADKLFDVMRSSHQIDVWCLVLAHVEPGNWIDETLAWIRRQFELPFELAVLSPKQHDIEGLFAAEPDLHASQYDAAPDPQPNSGQRSATVEAFGAFLDEATVRARESRSGGWQVVAPRRWAFDDDRDAAAAYLRGLRVTSRWEAISNEWATWRASSVAPLSKRVLESKHGFDFAWVVAAGGEGKSTVLRQVAWDIASNHDDWTVLWTEAALREQRVEIPVRLIEALGDQANVLLCVDGSAGLQGAERIHALAEQLVSSGKRVFVLFADRGAAWQRSRLPGNLAKGLPQAHRHIELEPLSESETTDLVEKLDSHSLLQASSRDAALQALGARNGDASAPWLLPTLMQLTDPEQRGFEGILISVLAGLRDETAQGAILLLLTASIVQSAGGALPAELAERLVRDEGGLTQSMEVLTAELERQFGVPREAMGVENPPGALVTHHPVIAEGFVGVAEEAQCHERLLEACGAFPLTIAEETNPDEVIPRPRFILLEGSVNYLRAIKPPPHEAIDRFLRAVVALDDRQFPAFTQLADANADWLRDELKEGDRQRVDWLVEEARRGYRTALETSREILGDRETCPLPYRRLKLDSQESIISHSWGVLEDTIGQSTGDTTTLKRAVMLFLQSIQDRGLTTLALPLIHMGEYARASLATAAYRERGKRRRDQPSIRNQVRLLKQQKQAVPDIGVAALDVLLPDLVLNLLLKDWEEIDLFDDREQHLDCLVLIMRRCARMLDSHDRLDRAIETLGRLR